MSHIVNSNTNTLQLVISLNKMISSAVDWGMAGKSNWVNNHAKTSLKCGNTLFVQKQKMHPCVEIVKQISNLQECPIQNFHKMPRKSFRWIGLPAYFCLFPSPAAPRKGQAVLEFTTFRDLISSLVAEITTEVWSIFWKEDQLLSFIWHLCQKKGSAWNGQTFKILFLRFAPNNKLLYISTTNLILSKDKMW